MTAERRVGVGIAVLGAALVARATLAPRPPVAGAPPHWCSLCDPYAGVDVLLNVLLFVPLGFGLRLAGLSRRGALTAAAALAVAIELLQLSVVSGRTASLGDIVSNVLGAALGIGPATRWRAFVLPAPAPARRLTTLGVLAWLAALAGTASLMAPASRGAREEVRLAPADRDARFAGVVLDASVDGVPAEAWTGQDARRSRRARGSHARVEAIVTPGPASPRSVPIVELVDARGRRVLALEQEVYDVSFRLRRRATVARLRTPSVTVWQALPLGDGSRAPTDTVRLDGWAEGYRMYLSARSQHGWNERMIELRPTLGWALILPFEHTLTAASRRFTTIWLALLLTPAGYWAARGTGVFGVRRGAPAARPALRTIADWLAAPAVVAAGLAAGLVVLPASLGLPPAYPWEWVGAGAGLALGGVAGLASRWVRLT